MSIYDKVEGWIIEYPEFDELTDKQVHAFWPWDEPQVEDDVQDLRVRMTKPEYLGTVDVLGLFTHYEIRAGEDYWANRIMRRFKRPEIQRMASMFSAVELNSHAPFYDQINKVLYLDNEEFYSSWKNDEVLRDRMNFIEHVVTHEDDLYSIGAFTFIEGAVLYASFAFLKHFQAQECGKDLIKNICRGINQSVGDENMHAVGGSMLFRRILMENPELNTEQLKETIYRVAQKTYEHEELIINRIFSHGEIKGISSEDLKVFVRHRIDLCLENLGFEPLYNEEKGFIESWFYKNINSVQLHDFFSGHGSEYHIKWSESKFGEVW